MGLQIEEEHRKCLKCGYACGSSDVGLDYACPKCGAIYAKLEALQKAKAEATEADKTEANNFERRMALQDKSDQKQIGYKEAERSQYYAAHAVYLLMILPLIITQVSAVVIAFNMRHPVNESWLNDHFRWQIRTFWYLLGLSLLAGAALLVGAFSMTSFVLLGEPGLFALMFSATTVYGWFCVLAGITAVYRIGKGWYRLSRRESP